MYDIHNGDVGLGRYVVRKMSAVQEAVKTALEQPLKLDIGCGKNKKEGFYGLDLIDFPGVDIVADLRKPRWITARLPEELKPRMEGVQAIVTGPPQAWGFLDNSVDEVHCSHFLEHLTNLNDKWERVHFFNELYRIMKLGATAHLVFPHWASTRFYGDPTHKEPFSEMGFYYLTKKWRVTDNNAPHADIEFNPNGYSCDFDATWGYSLHQSLHARHQDHVQYALANFKEAAQDIMATLTKPLAPR